MAAISYSNKFIFIHIPKVAGNSIRKALSPYIPRNYFGNLLNKSATLLGEDRLFRKAYIPTRFKVFPPHIWAMRLQKYIPEYMFDKYYKFAFVRNPWDRLVSFYHFILARPQHNRHHIIKTFNDFPAYIDWIVENDVRLQKKHVADKNGNIIVDYVGRFENISNDFSHISNQIGVTASLPHINISQREDYKNYYTDELAEKIFIAFREDIEFFGYQYD
jgi:hypothetical protein